MVTLAGLPAKPALRYFLLFQWYQEAHEGPTPRRSPLSRVYRWWFSLSEAERQHLTDRAQTEIIAFNRLALVRKQERLQAQLQAKLAKCQAAFCGDRKSKGLREEVE